MLTFKRQSLEIEDEDKNLFVDLHLDTHRTGYLSSWDAFFQGKLINSKPWIGEVKTNEKQFKISRTGIGILRSSISSIVIKGQEVNDGSIKRIKLAYGLSWIAAINIVIVTFLLTFVGILYFHDIWSLLILLSIWIIPILLIVLDLNITEERFNKYLDSREVALHNNS